MSKLFGANWLTSTLGLAEKGFYTLATFILAYPDSVKAIINPTYHLYYGVAVLLLGFVLGGAKDVHTKDKSVTGGTVQNDPPALKPGDPGIKSALCLLCALVAGLGLTACNVFTPASTAKAGDGKIPVHVDAGVNASGTTDSSTVNYDGGVKIVFGKNTPLSVQQRICQRLGIPLPAPTPVVQVNGVPMVKAFAPPAPSPTPANAAP